MRVVNTQRHVGALGERRQYIGRKLDGMHFGNPFSHQPGSVRVVRVATREEAIARFRTWLEGTTDQDVEPERRRWILAHEHELEDSDVLICFCKPLACHGDVYVERAAARKATKVA